MIDNPENDLALFVPNRAYKIKLADRLQITPNVVYKNMNDLSYRWVIDGREVATTKDLDWECDMEANRVYCYFEIHRNSAGNSTIFPFSIELDQPYVTGYNLLVEKDGALRYDFISYTVAALYTFDYYENGAGIPDSFHGRQPPLAGVLVVRKVIRHRQRDVPRRRSGELRLVQRRNPAARNDAKARVPQ